MTAREIYDDLLAQARKETGIESLVADESGPMGTALPMEKLNHPLLGLLGLGSARAVPYLCDSWRDTSKMKR